jgi:hypothetical protein
MLGFAGLLSNLARTVAWYLLIVMVLLHFARTYQSVLVWLLRRVLLVQFSPVRQDKVRNVSLNVKTPPCCPVQYQSTAQCLIYVLSYYSIILTFLIFAKIFMSEGQM